MLVNGMDLNEFLGPNPIVIHLRAENRWQVIDELIDALVSRGKIEFEVGDSIADAVKKRKQR